MSNFTNFTNITSTIQEDCMWQDEKANKVVESNVIIICAVSWPGRSVPTTPELQDEITASFGPQGSEDAATTSQVHRSTGIGLNELDAWADSHDPVYITYSWYFRGIRYPVFTTRHRLIRDTAGGWGSGVGGLVFGQNLDRERKVARFSQITNGASSDSYMIDSEIPRPRNSMSCCAGVMRSKPYRAVSDHRCSATEGFPFTNERRTATPIRTIFPPSYSSQWDAEGQPLPARLLEASRRYAVDAHQTSGSTAELLQTMELRQRMLALRQRSLNTEDYENDTTRGRGAPSWQKWRSPPR